jgi:hypothetical protein
MSKDIAATLLGAPIRAVNEVQGKFHKLKFIAVGIALHPGMLLVPDARLMFGPVEYWYRAE